MIHNMQNLITNKGFEKKRDAYINSSPYILMLSTRFECGAPPTATDEILGAPDQATAAHAHGEEHVKKLFSTAVIVIEDTHSNLVRGHCFTGEDTNIFHPWSLKLEGFFRKSTNISFYMVTNLFIYTTGSSHIIDDCSRAVCFCQSLIGL